MTPATTHPPRHLQHRDAILLVSCYELGQQPLGLASAAAALEAVGFEPTLVDLAVDALDERAARRARLIGFSIPMHTATRLAVEAVDRIRTVNPGAVIAMYGLYAGINSEALLDGVADVCLGAEFEEGLVALAGHLDKNGSMDGFPRAPNLADELTHARRGQPRIPSRSQLEPFDRYARLVHGDETREAAAVVATRGCKHLCRHCPLPPVYGGRFYAIPEPVVLGDIAALVAGGIRHITFADPDFLNGPGHALRIVRALHARHPGVTFDYTAKVEHLLRHRDIVAELTRLGCAFVVSAVESMSDVTLKHLMKGHSRADVVELIEFCRSIGLTLRPSLVPFTPWDTLESYLDLLRMVAQNGLIDNIDPVQYGIRLLVPPGSHLLSVPEMLRHLGPLDAGRLTYEWRHPDARMDQLQSNVAAAAEAAVRTSEDTSDTFHRIYDMAVAAAGENDGPDWRYLRRRFPKNRTKPPRLSEDWFC